jgi:hypothetical protein
MKKKWKSRKLTSKFGRVLTAEARRRGEEVRSNSI